MANIMINDVCNCRCEYCFANEYVNGDTRTDMTYKEFKTVVDWIIESSKQANIKEPIRIAIMGGEPLLHHDLESLITYTRIAKLPGQEVVVFTNGLLLDKYAKLFAQNNVSCLINMNSPKGQLGEARYQKTVENLRKARMQGMDFTLGVNYFDPELDMSFIYDIVEEFGLKEVRVGLVCPNTDQQRSEGPFEYMTKLREPILQFAETLATMRCGIHLDCQKFPDCIMADESPRIDNIKKTYGVKIDLLEHSKCTPVIDVKVQEDKDGNRELKVFRCFGVSKPEYAVPLSKFRNEADAMGYFEKHFDNLGMYFNMKEECENCYFNECNKCQGGCIGYKLERMDKARKKE